jgi:murein L,D-transpeptidase YafK
MGLELHYPQPRRAADYRQRLVSWALMTFDGRRLCMSIFLWAVIPNPVIAQDSCPPKGSAIIVQTQERRLYLCQNSEVIKEYPVALARGGFGKRAYHDHKNPLGEYSLGTPRTSPRFHLFIPIGYPTEEQKRQGYTGQDVGIHGPSPRFKWAGRLNAWFGWTDGCIAPGTDAEIDEIAAWVRRAKATRITIR